MRVHWGDAHRSSDHKAINYLGIDSCLTKVDLETLNREEIHIGDVDILRAYALENNNSNDEGGNAVSIGIATHNANSSPAATDALQKRLDYPNEIFTHKECI